jgi:hypothetical protein
VIPLCWVFISNQYSHIVSTQITQHITTKKTLNKTTPTPTTTTMLDAIARNGTAVMEFMTRAMKECFEEEIGMFVEEEIYDFRQDDDNKKNANTNSDDMIVERDAVGAHPTDGGAGGVGNSGWPWGVGIPTDREKPTSDYDNEADFFLSRNLAMERIPTEICFKVKDIQRRRKRHETCPNHNEESNNISNISNINNPLTEAGTLDLFPMSTARKGTTATTKDNKILPKKGRTYEKIRKSSRWNNTEVGGRNNAINNNVDNNVDLSNSSNTKNKLQVPFGMTHPTRTRTGQDRYRAVFFRQTDIDCEDEVAGIEWYKSDITVIPVEEKKKTMKWSSVFLRSSSTFGLKNSVPRNP